MGIRTWFVGHEMNPVDLEILKSVTTGARIFLYGKHYSGHQPDRRPSEARFVAVQDVYLSLEQAKRKVLHFHDPPPLALTRRVRPNWHPLTTLTSGRHGRALGAQRAKAHDTCQDTT